MGQFVRLTVNVIISLVFTTGLQPMPHCLLLIHTLTTTNVSLSDADVCIPQIKSTNQLNFFS